ncbi:uncharacterized protein BT62DRAFT_935193 [Guyanagaster necrorhizus]|uniref:Uncharacterized protein n=1 Tax=Guyanagaster necrorhizus TaxID=856835 RepID=A0A9P8APQ6_9AGAR|nr:uncharacterized protein BT62DRAFT_935193 [Guyanagaster necrorhizus MCA 3950]KAG7443239.1 hypothetical protein BT62DRAFT_935193 [Guyanagaster necrorhizus MCA 3950]
MLFLGLVLVAKGSPFPAGLSSRSQALVHRTAPYFPDSPASCPICEQNYSSIENCAEAAPVLANFSMIIFNPGAFINVIECACTETFQSVFPQCVDCFQATNQTDVLEGNDLPSIVSGMRKICALESTLLGNVSESDGEVTVSASASSTGSASTSTSSSAAIPRAVPISLSGLYTILSVALSLEISTALL